jgi:hypothetical protein
MTLLEELIISIPRLFMVDAGVTSANSNTTKYNEALINSYFKIKPFKFARFRNWTKRVQFLTRI